MTALANDLSNGPLSDSAESPANIGEAVKAAKDLKVPKQRLAHGIVPSRRGVAVMLRSQDTGGRLPKYLASERKRSLLRLARESRRSVYRPPGCRWPAVHTSVPSWSAVHVFSGWPSAR